MKKVITLKEALISVLYYYKDAKIIKTWDDKEVTEVLFASEGKTYELYSSTDPYYKEDRLYTIFEN